MSSNQTKDMEKTYIKSGFNDIIQKPINIKDLDRIIKKTRPTHVVETFYEVMYNNNKLSHYNMFIMKKEDFDKYCEWLFPILFEMEKNIEFTHYNDQGRVFGYMAERLFNVWLKSNQKKLIFKPIIRFTENQYKEHFLKYSFTKVQNTISFLALKQYRGISKKKYCNSALDK